MNLNASMELGKLAINAGGPGNGSKSSSPIDDAKGGSTWNK